MEKVPFSYAYAYVTPGLRCLCLCLCHCVNQPYVTNQTRGKVFQQDFQIPRTGLKNEAQWSFF